MKKLLLFILPLLLALSAKASEFTVGNFKFYIHDYVGSPPPTSVRLIGVVDQSISGHVDIPSAVEYRGKSYPVTEIGGFCFYGCGGITSVSIPSSVTAIRERCFHYCYWLSSIFIPESVTEIKGNVFKGCSCLNAIEVSEYNPVYSSEDGILYAQNKLISFPGGKKNCTIPGFVNTIGEMAFSGVCNIDSLIIPNTVTSIERNAFSYSSLCYVVLPDSITTLTEYVLSGTHIEEIYIPATVTTIEKMAFEECGNLVSVKIPNSVTIINNDAFHHCVSLTSVTIPSSITSIGSRAFAENSALLTVNYETDNPVEVGYQSIFDDETYEKARLNIAYGGSEKAQTTSPWKYFANIKEVDFSGIEDVVADLDPEAPVEVYDLNGIKVLSGVKAIETVDNLPAGLYIVRQGNVSRKIAVK